VILFCGLKVYQVPKYIEGRQYNMGTVDTPISLAPKKEQRTVIHFCVLKVYQVPKYIEGRQYNMGTVDTPISLAPKKEQSPVIHFCGMKVYQVPKCIEGRQYNMGTVSYRNGIERFKNGRTSLKHEEGTRRQPTSISDADTERVYGMILQKR